MRGLPYPYDGTVDESFDSYSRQAAAIRPAIVQPLIYPAAPDSGRNAPFRDSIGAVVTSQALVGPLGAWHPVYQGSIPWKEQPKIASPEPWLDPKVTW